MKKYSSRIKNSNSAVLSFKVKKGPKNKDFQKKSAKKVKYDSFNDY